MSNPSKMEVNAAIECLITEPKSSQWKEWALTVIAFAQYALTKEESFTFSFTNQSPSDSGSVTGHTPEAGNVTVKDEDGSKAKTYEIGTHRARVGHYKVSRHVSKKLGNVLHIQHFWKADVETFSETETPTLYMLPYNADHQPTDFGREGTKPWIRIPLFIGALTVCRNFYCSLIDERVQKKIGHSFMIHLHS